MIFVACYTIDTPYEEEAAKLRASLEELGLDHDIEGYESRGSWLANCHYIPIFCRKMLEKHRGKNVVYLDADAVVQKFPVLLFQIDREEKVDFAVHHLKRSGWGTQGELLDGTMYFRNTSDSLRLLDAWIEADERALLGLSPLQLKEAPREAFEQKILEVLLPKFPIQWVDLPPEYCFIFDNPIQRKGIREEPSIVHYQASRRLRKTQPKMHGSASFLLKQLRPFAVVGNGAGFMDGMGPVIDRHPTIIRLNNFVLGSYEERVGKRTTTWCVNGEDDVPYRELAVPVFTPFGQKDLYKISARWSRVPHLMVPDHCWAKKAKEACLLQNPSTGFVLLYMLETLGVETDAYGFDSFRSGHYWDPEPFPNCHSGSEGELLSRFKFVRMQPC